MCGIVGAVAQRDVVGILVEGLKRLEYRGYDSAGLSVLESGALATRKNVGKVAGLEEKTQQSPVAGGVGIAHTRWATHGEPSENNAHPHCFGDVAIVHNGIIENYVELRDQLMAKGHVFVSETDSETLAHLIYLHMQDGCDLLTAVQKTAQQCEGAYGLAAVCASAPDKIAVARSGSPLVIGLGIGEMFIASDQLALRQVTDRFIFLEEGDTAELTQAGVTLFDADGKKVERDVVQLADGVESAERGEYRHFMLKEIFEQPAAIARTLAGRLGKEKVLEAAFGASANKLLSQVEHVQIVACGTSYHAGMVAKYWLEDWGGLPCSVEVASEYRYRRTVVPKNSLFVSISQSGETADTLAALRGAKQAGFLGSLSICNVANSSLVRESDIALMTFAGPEIGVASTKAFTTQLVALHLLAIVLGRHNGLSTEKEKALVAELHQLESLCEKTLALAKDIEHMSESFAEKHHSLFLGRGVQFPIALEGALKLKEISYIHAEAYPAGELKHGPLALVDSDMPVVAVAPNNELLEKLKSNLEVVQARGGKLFVFADAEASVTDDSKVLIMPSVADSIAPIIYTLPLQLLSYYVAVLKGTDVDQPRNLAKSVTVE